MKCIRAKQLIQEYLDNHLPEQEKKELEEHIQSCNSCKEELAEYKNLFSDVDLLNEV